MPMEVEKPQLTDVLPSLAEELRGLFSLQGHLDLVAQLSTVRVHDKCRCGEDFCSSIYTAPKPEDAWRAGHETIVVDPREGMINVDLVNRTIVYIEILDRSDIRKSADKATR
jgi:hypothetical protein